MTQSIGCLNAGVTVVFGPGPALTRFDSTVTASVGIQGLLSWCINFALANRINKQEKMGLKKEQIQKSAARKEEMSHSLCTGVVLKRSVDRKSSIISGRPCRRISPPPFNYSLPLVPYHHHLGYKSSHYSSPAQRILLYSFVKPINILCNTILSLSI